MPLTAMQRITIDGLLNFDLEDIDNHPAKPHALLALNAMLLDNVPPEQEVFLSACITNHGQDTESNLWVNVMAVRGILQHPNPQLPFGNGQGMFNLIRDDPDAGNHFPPVTAEEVKEYVRQQINDRIAALRVADNEPAIIPAIDMATAIGLHIERVRHGIGGFLNRARLGEIEKTALIGVAIGVAIGAVETIVVAVIGKEVLKAATGTVVIGAVGVIGNLVEEKVAVGVAGALAGNAGTLIITIPLAFRYMPYLQHPWIIPNLINAGVSPDIQDANGNTPLHLALAANNTEAAMEFIKAGAPLDVKNKDGYYPFQLSDPATTNAMYHYVQKEELYGDIIQLEKYGLKLSPEHTTLLDDKSSPVKGAPTVRDWETDVTALPPVPYGYMPPAPPSTDGSHNPLTHTQSVVEKQLARLSPESSPIDLINPNLALATVAMQLFVPTGIMQGLVSPGSSTHHIDHQMNRELLLQTHLKEIKDVQNKIKASLEKLYPEGDKASEHLKKLTMDKYYEPIKQLYRGLVKVAHHTSSDISNLNLEFFSEQKKILAVLRKELEAMEKKMDSAPVSFSTKELAKMSEEAKQRGPYL